MAKVADALTFNESEIRDVLRLDANTPSATVLELYFDGAVEEADEFLNNDFIDADENDIPIPSRVKIGVYKLIKLAVNAGDAGRAGDETSINTDGLSVGYRPPEEAAQGILDQFMRKWRMNPGF
jgi:hypothetical protein